MCGLHAPVKSPAGCGAPAGHTHGIEKADAKKGGDPGGWGRRAGEPPAPAIPAKGEEAQGPAVKAWPDRPEVEARGEEETQKARGSTPLFTAPPSSLASSSGDNAVGVVGVAGANMVKGHGQFGLTNHHFRRTKPANAARFCPPHEARAW